MVGSATEGTPVYIWVRTAIDWSDEGAYRSQLKPEFLPKLERWNAMFAMPYHAFRHEVSEIARLNLSRVEGASVASWDEIPAGAVVLPVDDDDWFAPNIVERLRPHLDPEVIGYRWDASYLEVPVGLRHRVMLARRRLVPGTPPRWTCGTNSYAVVKRPGVEPVADDHCRASEVFELEHTRVPVVSERLSLTNRTLASQTTLFHDKPAISHARLLLKYRAYRRLYRAPDLRGLEWADEYVARMAGLMRRLTLRSVRTRPRRT